MNQNKNPLVSIIVITYNSANFVLETLESAKSQTYQNIELIISDDGSSDNTVEICKEWLKNNKESFVNTELITVEKNTGIPANCNRGVNASKGEWIKLIAGDDIMSENMISVYVTKIKSLNKNIFLCSNHKIINGESKVIGSSSFHNTKYFSILKTAFEQYQMALRISGTVPTLTAFYSREMYDEVGGFDEKYRLLEDYLFFLKSNEKGYYAKLIQDELAYYRRSSIGVTAQNIKGKLFGSVYLQVLRVQRDYCASRLPKIERLSVCYVKLIHDVIDKIGLNNMRYKNIYWLLQRTNPYIIKRFLLGCNNNRYYKN